MNAKIIGGVYCKVIIGETAYHLSTSSTYPLDGANPPKVAEVLVASNTWRSAIYAHSQYVAAKSGDSDLYEELRDNYDKGEVWDDQKKQESV